MPYGRSKHTEVEKGSKGRGQRAQPEQRQRGGKVRVLGFKKGGGR